MTSINYWILCHSPAGSDLLKGVATTRLRKIFPGRNLCVCVCVSWKNENWISILRRWWQTIPLRWNYIQDMNTITRHQKLNRISVSLLEMNYKNRKRRTLISIKIMGIVIHRIDRCLSYSKLDFGNCFATKYFEYFHSILISFIIPKCLRKNVNLFRLFLGSDDASS